MKKLFLILFILISASASVLYYYWLEATKIPDWYPTNSSISPSTPEFTNSSEIQTAESRLQAKIDASIANSQNNSEESLPTNGSYVNSTTNREQQKLKRKDVEVKLSNQEINQLIMGTISKQLNRRKSPALVPTFYTNIKEGNLESGTVINLSELPKDQFSKNENALIDKVQKNFPFLENKKIYIGIAGQPKIEAGKLKLDNNSKVKLGNLSLSLSELSQRLNIPQEQLEQKLNMSLQLGRLKVNDMELTDNNILLKGSVAH